MRQLLVVLALSWLACAVGGASESAPARPVDWSAILGPTRARWPAPQDSVVWRNDLDEALREARASGRPVFVTLRCLPCKQCSEFDKDVLEGGPELDPLLSQFITVRLVSMRDPGVARLPYPSFQDLDLSWWGYFLDADGLLGIYGGKDEVSDATRISVPSLARAMRRVLDHHYDPRRTDWSVMPGSDVLLPGRVESHPGWEGWAAHGAAEAAASECLHCHQVAEVLRQPAIAAQTFDKRTDFWTWPYPENVGLTLDRGDGLLVTAVDDGSPAAAIGVRTGDRLGAAGGLVLFGQADFRGVLHRASRGEEPARIELVWTRGDAAHVGVLALAAGWRRTDLGWRKSVAEAGVGAWIGFPWPLAVGASARRRLGIEPDALAVRAFFPKGPSGAAGDAGLRGDQVIVAVNGERPGVAERAFIVWFRRRFDPGESIELTVLDPAGRESRVRYEAPGP